MHMNIYPAQRALLPQLTSEIPGSRDMSSASEEKSFRLAAAEGKIEEVKGHLERDPKLIDKPAPGTGKTALHWACTFVQPAVVKFLLEKKANPNILDNNSNPPIFIALMQIAEQINGKEKCKDISHCIEAVRICQMLLEAKARVMGDSGFAVKSNANDFLKHLKLVDLLKYADKIDKVPIFLRELKAVYELIRCQTAGGTSSSPSFLEPPQGKGLGDLAKLAEGLGDLSKFADQYKELEKRFQCNKSGKTCS